MIKCKNVRKEYSEFILDDINLELPEGCILGLIGENGAGKSTLISCILGTVKMTSGGIEVLGKDIKDLDYSDKEKMGVVLEKSVYSDVLTAKDINLIMKNMYRTWNEELFFKLCTQYGLSKTKKFKEYSKGMKMKLSIAVALSHDPKLLILDEATSGLDPVARDEILDIFFDFVQDGKHSILMSSHILSDLEKVCDLITFISKGKILLSSEKDELEKKYCIIKCNEQDYSNLDKTKIIGCKKTIYSIEVCIEKEACPINMKYDHASIEDIMVFSSKGVTI